MNIFYLSRDTKECAELHTDKHVVKMILEYAQLLSTAHRILDGTVYTDKTANNRKILRWKLENNIRENTLYKATHANHPSAIWVRQSRDNYAWLWKLLNSVCEEYTYRYGKVHKVQRDGLLEELRFVPSGIAEHPSFTEPTPAMPDKYKVINDSITSYKNYYVGDKQHLASWKKRNVPNWYAFN